MKRFLSLLLVVLMFTSMLAITADAASFTNIKSGAAYTLKAEYKYANAANTRNATYYKLTLKSDSLLKIKWSGKSAKVNIQIFLDAAMTKSVDFVEYCSKASGTEYVALAKGTYYLDMYDGYSNYNYSPTAKVTITVTPVTKINKSNFCRAKAAALKAGAAATVVQTPDYSYPRWYKITLKKSQKITVTTTGSPSVDIYSAKLNRLSSEYSSGKYVTKDKLAKGTYYIRVGASVAFSHDCRGDYYTLKWK